MPEFQNPNLQSQGPSGGGGGGDLRSMLAIGFLAVAIFLGYEYFFQKPKPSEPVSPQQTQQQSISFPLKTLRSGAVEPDQA